MGNTRSWPERKACAQAPASPLTLSEREAFDIATAWHHQLSSFVLLDITSHYHRSYGGHDTPTMTMTQDSSAYDFTVVEHLEWIDFDLRGPPGGEYRGALSAARASTLAWFALACCPGFGGDENPVFWKRVFSAFMRPDTTSNRGQHLGGGAVTDRERFFEHPDRPFPRVRVAWFPGFPIELLWQAPLQICDEETLDHAMRQLTPFIRPTRWQRRIAVSIRVQGFACNLIEQLKRMDLEPHDTSSHDAFKLQLTTVFCYSPNFSKPLADAVARFPHARLCVLRNDSPWMLHDPKYYPAMVSVIAQQRQAPDPAAHVDVQSIWFWLQSGMVQSTDTIPSSCSMLPHKATVKGVYSLELDRTNQTADVYAAWLGYALFHPDVAGHASSVENLTLRVTGEHRSFVRTLDRMRFGNNLLYDSTLASEPIRGYHKARVRRGAIVRATPDDAQDELGLYQYPYEGWITLCEEQRGVPRATLWVRVVLPGHGLAWIPNTDIIQVVCHAATPSRVRRLRLLLFDHGIPRPRELSNDTLSVLLDVLSIFGNELTYLHLETHQCVCLSAAAVHSVLCQCPNLKSLRVAHDGTYWAGISPFWGKDDHTRLQELELSITDTLYSFTSLRLNDLRALSVVCAKPATFSVHRGAVKAILARYPMLAYFNWHYYNAGRHHNDTHVAYDAHCTGTLRLLSPWKEKAICMAAVPFQLDARLAFMSVIRHLQAQAPVNSRPAIVRLPQDALVLIFCFSTSFARRRIYIRD